MFDQNEIKWTRLIAAAHTATNNKKYDSNTIIDPKNKNFVSLINKATGVSYSWQKLRADSSRILHCQTLQKNRIPTYLGAPGQFILAQ